MKQKIIQILDDIAKESMETFRETNAKDIYPTWISTAKDRIQALGDGWIPVTERKPKKMQEVDFSDGKNVWLGYYDGFTNSVTHWRERPLPPTPKQ